MKILKKVFNYIYKFGIFAAKLAALAFLFSALGVNKFFISNSDRWVMRQVAEKEKIILEEQRLSDMRKDEKDANSEQSKVMRQMNARFKSINDGNMQSEYNNLYDEKMQSGGSYEGRGMDDISMENRSENSTLTSDLYQNTNRPLQSMGQYPSGPSQNVQVGVVPLGIDSSDTSKVNVSITVSESGASVVVGGDDSVTTGVVVSDAIKTENDKRENRRKAIFGGNQ